MIEGVDWSRGSVNIAELKAAGKRFAGRYCVSDLSPSGRGITADEYAALTAAEIETYVYWEGQDSWMLSGWTAGVSAAQNAVANIANAGMPKDIPVYFAHDIDPEPRHFDEIDDCLRGAAAVIGADRVGLYGGWLAIDHCHAAGTARYFAQTIAWQYGRGVHPAANLHQYDTGTNIIAGVNCDLVHALTEDYGQASAHDGIDIIVTEPKPKAAGIWWEEGDTGEQIRADGVKALAMLGEVTVTNSRGCKVRASVDGKELGKLTVGTKATIYGTHVQAKRTVDGRLSRSVWAFCKIEGYEGYPRIPLVHLGPKWPAL